MLAWTASNGALLDSLTAGRSQISEAVSLMNGMKGTLTEYHAAHGVWPVLGKDVQVTSSGKYTESIAIMDAKPAHAGKQNGQLVLVATMKSNGVDTSIQGKSVQLSTVDSGFTWVCRAMGNPPVTTKMLPNSCKN